VAGEGADGQAYPRPPAAQLTSRRLLPRLAGRVARHTQRPRRVHYGQEGQALRPGYVLPRLRAAVRRGAGEAGRPSVLSASNCEVLTIRVGPPAFNVLSLCSGAGGIELGLKLAVPTARTVCFVEREAYCCAVLAARMADGCLAEAPVWSDLRSFDGRPWRGVVDCVTGGYPCPPFSCCGKRKGKADPRHLWPEVARVVGEVGPEWCFFENVAGHLSLGFEQVELELRGMGYRVAAGLFSASEVGAPHERQRLFVVAHALHHRCRDAAEPPGGRGRRPAKVRTPHVPPRPGRLKDAPDADTRPPCPPMAFPSAPDDDEGWATMPPELEPALSGVADGLAAGMDRLRACGNGVVPAVAAHAWRTLAPLTA
jgi:DNA (cytosine-5)-methyltransferase 1